jgi:hypothetical protein
MPVRLTFPNRKAFELALNDFIEKEVPAAQWRLQRKVAFDLFAKIIQKNPVGNPDLWKSKKAPPGYVGGRSRANWQMSIGAPGADASKRPEGGVTGAPVSSAQQAEAFGKVAAGKPGDTIYIYNNVRYIRRLEEGWSGQAPAGMVAVSLAEVTAGLTG